MARPRNGVIHTPELDIRFSNRHWNQRARIEMMHELLTHYRGDSAYKERRQMFWHLAKFFGPENYQITAVKRKLRHVEPRD